MTEITVGNLKGGVGKTTTAVLTALGLAAEADAQDSEDKTLLVSADPQQSALKWAHVAGEDWPWDRVNVVAWTDHRTLGRQIESARGEYAHIVVDTPPSRTRVTRASLEAKTLEAALTATGNLIVTTSPSAIDLAEIADTFEVAEAVDAIRPVYTSVLVVRVLWSTKSATEAPAVLVEDFGYPVMQSRISAREPIAQAFGTAPALTGPFAGYADALTEIHARHDQQEA
ncbi:AAA family ATPase [Nocardia sp. NPDC003963]